MQTRGVLSVSAVLASVAIAGCGGGSSTDDQAAETRRSTDSQRAAVDRAGQTGCQKQRRAETYAAVGLREVVPLGETARRLQAILDDQRPAGMSRAEQERDGAAILSLGDGDSTGEEGESLDPKDREDVAVEFRLLVPGASPEAVRNILETNARETSAALRTLTDHPKVRSKIRGNVAYVTATYGTGRRSVREQTAVAVTSCALVAATGWPEHVERFMRVAAGAQP